MVMSGQIISNWLGQAGIGIWLSDTNPLNLEFLTLLSFLTDKWLNNELWNNGLWKSPQLLIFSFRNVFPETIQSWPNRIIILRHCLSQDLRSQFQTEKKNYLEMFNFLSTMTILSICLSDVCSRLSCRWEIVCYHRLLFHKELAK